MPWIAERAEEIGWNRLEHLMHETVTQARHRICAHPKRVLLLPPDITRMHSGAGRITEILYNLFREQDDAEVHVIPTLGQHAYHTADENRRMFGSIPNSHIHHHDWRGGCVAVGEIPGRFVDHASDGHADWSIPIELNRMLVEHQWDLVINVGHVVPHEVLGFANHNKNYFIGLGGKETICKSHMMAAACGIENNLGNLITPLRACFNRAEDEFLSRLPDLYVQVVLNRNAHGHLVHTGLYVGDDLETYLAAARHSREANVTVLEEPIERIVCVMQGDEFFSTWVANKAIYRTRMAIADGGELIIIAPGLKRFGEQPEVDMLIRKYGYVGTERVMAQYRENADMQDLAHATAHLIHGSTEGRFTVTYAPGDLTKEDIESVNYKYADIGEVVKRYQPQHRQEGWNLTGDGERFFYIPTPSAGLWAMRKKLFDRPGGFGDG
ncbi:MAG TPA: lactate racemase domain-containing protein [Pirellulales bacterium]|nr:lactate racemase domain-containing protein [Pirellulales bacterium]